MTYVWRIEVATNVRRFFLKTGLKNCHTLENEAIVHRRSATLKAFDAVALQWPSLQFQIRRTFASRFGIVCGQFYWARPMIFSQLVEICRQLVESRTVIADTRRNIVVNSSELGFNVVSYCSNSYDSRSNSSELGFNIVLYRSNSYTTRRNSCYVAVLCKAPRTHEKPRH